MGVGGLEKALWPAPGVSRFVTVSRIYPLYGVPVMPRKIVRLFLGQW